MRRLRICVVGCGRAFQLFHSPALSRSRRWELAAACDSVPERLEGACRRHPGVRCFSSLAEVPADMDLDAVLIATPPAAHVTIAAEALSRGLGVLIEKPMALEAEEARRLADTARTAGAVVRIGFNRRFRRNYEDLRDRIARLPPSSLADVEYVWLADPRRWAPASDAAGAVDARALLLHDLGSHQMDLFAWLTGQRLVAVEALGPRAGASGADRVAYRATLADGMTACGLVGWGSRYRERVRVVARGEMLSASPGGLLRVPARLSGRLNLVERPLEIAHLAWSKVRQRPSMTALSFRGQLDSFADAILGKPAPELATEVDGLRAVLAVEACLRSLKSGRPEEVG